MKSIGIVICYFGKWPAWLTYFLKSCAYNTTIDWLIFSDFKLPIQPKYNIKYHLLSKEHFNKLATRKLNFDINIEDSYKLCDFKPTYGKIFEDYLKPYNFWGYSDIDVIYGQIRNFLSDNILTNYDIVSTYKGFLSGPFCVYRNIPIINNLFTKSSRSKKILQNPSHIGFDENIARVDIFGFSIRKLVWFIKYIFLDYHNSLLFLSKQKEFRYQFQWFVKQKTINRDQLSDMSEVVYSASKNKQIKSLFTDIMISDTYFDRIKKKKWQINWGKGMLSDNKNNKELFAFHFLKLKKDSSFKIWDIKDHVTQFEITPQGILYEK